MKYIRESNSLYKIGDIILIEYWYNDMITPVKIIDIKGRKYEVSHNISHSKIFNAPNEIILKEDILYFYTKKK